LGRGNVVGDVVQSIQITFHLSSFPIATADLLKRNLIILNCIPPPRIEPPSEFMLDDPRSQNLLPEARPHLTNDALAVGSPMSC
jgi:hypothetical protein